MARGQMFARSPFSGDFSSRSKSPRRCFYLGDEESVISLPAPSRKADLM